MSLNISNIFRREKVKHGFSLMKQKLKLKFCGRNFSSKATTMTKKVNFLNEKWILLFQSAIFHIFHNVSCLWIIYRKFTDMENIKPNLNEYFFSLVLFLIFSEHEFSPKTHTHTHKYYTSPHMFQCEFF